MKAYYLVGALILFNLSLPVAATLGFAAPSGVDPQQSGFAVQWNWADLALTSMGMFIIGALASVAGFRINLGAMVFAAVFVASNSLFSGTLRWLSDTYAFPATVASLINFVVWVVFVFGFIQLGSAPVERD